MDRADHLKEWLDREGKFTFSRSGGPGGQNVNKSDTKVTLRISIERIPLSSLEKNRVRVRLAARINSLDELVISSSFSRSQKLNRNRAVQKAAALILSSCRNVKARRATHPSASSRLKRLRDKKHRSVKKMQREKPSDS